MTEWNIQSRAHVCQACHSRFADGQPYHTLLYADRSAYSRLDICESCWTAQYSQGATDKKGFISHWRGTYETPPVAPDPIQKDTAETLLRKLLEANDPQYAGARYILAVMLERKRVLKVKAQTTAENQRVFIYEHPKTGDVFSVLDPNLQLNQLEEVQRTVAQLLEHGLNPPVDPTAAPTAESMDPSAIPDPITPDTGAPEPTVENPSSLTH